MLVPGVDSVTFRALSVPRSVELAASCGMWAVEWSSRVHVPTHDLAAAREARERCADAGLAVSAYGSSHRVGVSPPADWPPVLATARELGAPEIRATAGDSGSASTSPARRAEVVAAVRAAAEDAGRFGVRLSLARLPGTLTDTLESAVLLAAEVGHGAAVPCWRSTGGQRAASAVEEVRALLPRLTAAYVGSRDRDGRRLPAAAREDLWMPVLRELARDGVERHVVLESAAEDVRADAAVLLGWVSAAA
ncbi:TIM barrel protein [Actinosynnema sp. NPDC020468]|uniref:sugar phosphate isomerase/epimerase family protein n=1 Tax=Actinosynnema sp. NPDC020468 TaxID=3154488 RepID=UPI0033C5B324